MAASLLLSLFLSLLPFLSLAFSLCLPSTNIRSHAPTEISRRPLWVRGFDGAVKPDGFRFMDLVSDPTDYVVCAASELSKRGSRSSSQGSNAAATVVSLSGVAMAGILNHGAGGSTGSLLGPGGGQPVSPGQVEVRLQPSSRNDGSSPVLGTTVLLLPPSSSTSFLSSFSLCLFVAFALLLFRPS